VASSDVGVSPEKQFMFDDARKRWWALYVLCSGVLMIVLDTTIVNVALPSISGTLGATIEQITWVVTGYILANVIIMPLVALLSQRFGRKNFYMASVVIFTLASMACGLARNLPAMVFFRALQGIGGGVLLTVSQAILRETFPAEEQGTAMGIFGLGVVASALQQSELNRIWGSRAAGTLP